MSNSLTKAVIPMAPESLRPVAGEKLPSIITFMVNPTDVYSPQTGHPWFIEMDHEMNNPSMYSLIPQKSDNKYANHYRVDRRRPRFAGEFKFADAWLATNRVVDNEIHWSQTFFHPQKANDKLYFDRPPYSRIEIVADGLIGDREIFQILERIVPKEYEIQSLLQRQS